MNNKPKVKKLTGNKAHSKSLKRSLLTDLVTYEHLETTESKAKAIIPMFDDLINMAKGSNRRHIEMKLNRMLFTKAATDKVLDILVKRLKSENGGYLNYYKSGRRKGDNAPMIKMIIKGYAYREVGSKTEKKKTKKDIKETKEAKQFEVNEIKDMTVSQSQVDLKGSQGKAKSRSGI